MNEPNYQAWKFLVETETNGDEPSDTAIDGLFSDYIDEASVAVTRTFEDSFRMLKSVMEMMAFIEGLRVRHLDGTISSKADKRLDRLSNDKFSNQTDRSSPHQRSGWSSELMVQLHNMCANGQTPSVDHGKVTKRYGTYLEPDHDILPPKPSVTRYEH